MDAAAYARLAALPLAAGAGVLAWLGEAGAAVVLLVAAVALPVAVGRPPAARDVPAAQRPLAELVAALDLRGHGIHAPAGAAVRLFVPADPDVRRVPDLAGRVLHRQTPAALGVALTPPGQPLEDAWAAVAALPDGRGTPEAARHLRAALTGLGLAQDVRVEAAGAAGAPGAAGAAGSLRVRYRPTRLAEACREAREDLAPWHDQGGCPVCSLVAMLVSRCHAAPVRFVGIAADDGAVRLDLEVLPRTSPRA